MTRTAALLLLIAPSAALPAQPAPSIRAVDPLIRTRAEGLIAVIAGRGDYARYFDADFKDQVSPDQFRIVREQLAATLGAPLSIESVSPTGAWSADIVMAFDHGTATAKLALAAAPPHAVTGLLVTGVAPRAETVEALAAEVRALPGASAIGIYALGEGTPKPILAVHAQDTAPIGSAFKLWVLAEAARQVAQGQRRWSDVVAAGRPSLGGVLGSWPAGSAVTLQTLATLMVSISDNTATDTLMAALGRRAIDAMAAANGGAVPVPTTREIVAIKSDPALGVAWTADPAGRTRLLATHAARIDAATLDSGVFSGLPVAVDSIEWFASPTALAGTLDRLRREGGQTALDILAVNPGVDPGTASRFAYLGFKGGSEPGVVTLNFLARTKAGRWYAVTGNWHRADATVSEARFVGLMTRALTLITTR